MEPTKSAAQSGRLDIEALRLALEMGELWGAELAVALPRLADWVGARRAQWLGAAGGETTEARRDGLEFDWQFARGLGAGEVRWVDEGARARRPRSAAHPGVEALAADPADVRGVLRLVWDQAPGLSDDVVRELARWIGELARAAARAGEQARRAHELRLGARTATITHDLRNQLNLALLQLAKHELNSQDELGPRAGAELSNLRGLLADARDMCRETLLHPERRATRKPIDLRRVLVEEARAAAEVARGLQRVGVSVRCPAGVSVLGERDALRRLIGNLMLNAIEACSEGGAVRASAEARSQARVVISIEDEGHGMSVEALEGFFRQGKSDVRGTGFGTSSVLEAAAALGAELEVESAPGAGTCVRVHLHGVPAAGQRALILCDAEPHRRARWVAALERAGFAAWAAGGPSEALTLMRAFSSPRLLWVRGSHGDELESLIERTRRERLACLVVGARDGGPERVLARAEVRAFLGRGEPEPSASSRA